ncbi:MAG: YncE family protein, partial [Streptosporangiaceae bacterium]
MDETSLRALLERAVADEPPAGPIVSRSVEAGVRLRRRRRVRGAVACAAVVVAAGAAIPVLRTGSRQAPAAGFAVPPTLYVTAAYDGNVTPAGAVTPISVDTGKVGRPIEAAQSESIISTSDGRMLFVASNVSTWVRPISTVTRTVGPAIKVGLGPVAMAITPDGKTLYVIGANINLASGWVTQISVASDKAAPSIQVRARPDAIAITPDGKTAYVLCTGTETRIGDFTGPGTVTPISVATNTAGRPITVGREPGTMAITPDGKTLYVSNFGSDTVTPISVATNTAGRPIPAGREPGAMAITPDGKTLYVADVGSDT